MHFFNALRRNLKRKGQILLRFILKMRNDIFPETLLSNDYVNRNVNRKIIVSQISYSTV